MFLSFSERNKMQGNFVKAILILQICIFAVVGSVAPTICGSFENEILSEMKSMQIKLEEYRLIVGKEEVVPDKCSSYSTCSTCLQEKENSKCGWCVLRNRCSLIENCSENDSDSNSFISEKRKCPKIRAVIPHSIPVSEIKMLEVIIPHLPDGYEAFICSFEALGKTLLTKGIKFERGIACESPNPNNLPDISIEEDHLNVELSVRTLDGPNFAGTSNFTIFDCSHYETCSKCSSSDFPCSWCIAGRKCTHDVYKDCKRDTIVFSKGVIRPTTRQGPGYCPRLASFIQKIENKTEIDNVIRIPSGTKKRISAKVENIMVSNESVKFTCKVDGFPEVNAQLLGDTLYCDEINFRLNGRQSVYRSSFNIFWNGREMEKSRDLFIEVYHCNRMASSCSECIDLKSSYNCGWCEASHSCTMKDDCEDDWMNGMNKNYTCRGPKITAVRPTSVIMGTATILTIEGINLAKNSTDIEDIFLYNYAGERFSNCTPYANIASYSRIECSLNASDIEFEKNTAGHVGLKLQKESAFSDNAVFFVNPVIKESHPEKGLVSGGQYLKIFGENLDAGKEAEVFIGDVPCNVISRTQAKIRCLTSPLPVSEKAPLKSEVRVRFDGREFISPTSFEYVPDPIVNNITGEQRDNTLRGTPSGGNIVIAFGTNFLAMSNPYFYVIADGVEYYGLCVAKADDYMECLTPKLPAETLNFCGEEGTRSLPFGFMLGETGRLQSSERADFGMYTLYPDPQLMTFSGERKILPCLQNGHMIIEGKHLDTVFNRNDYKVTAGADLCRVTYIESTVLVCRIDDVYVNDNNKLQIVLVNIRSRLHYFIGFLRNDSTC